MSCDVQFDLNTVQQHLIQIFEDPYVRGSARLICALIFELKNVSTVFHQFALEKDDSNNKYEKLSEELKELKASLHNVEKDSKAKNCNKNNVIIKQEMPELLPSPMIKSEKISMEKTYFENNLIDDNTNFEEIQETLLEIPSSPILYKCKSKTSKLNTSSHTSDSPNKTSKSVNNENDISKSPNVPTNDSSINTVFKKITTPSTKMKKMPKKSLKKSQLTMKQSRIRFKNTKQKASSDISQTKSFFGGIRNSNSIEISENSSISNKVHKNTPLNDIESIEESPSCIPHNKWKSSKHKFPEFLVNHIPYENRLDDDDETILTTSPKNKKKRIKLSLNTNHEISNSSSKALNSDESFSLFGIPNENILHKIQTNKISDENKLRGWSCKKCSDFFSIAHKGNEEMLRKQMDFCYNKHRNKFNPERRNTPPGFWDVNLKLTPTENTLNNENT